MKRTSQDTGPVVAEGRGPHPDASSAHPAPSNERPAEERPTARPR